MVVGLDMALVQPLEARGWAAATNEMMQQDLRSSFGKKIEAGIRYASAYSSSTHCVQTVRYFPNSRC
jgi:hypothetical protein